jgi:RHH-type proline utilization regulon transcriptional repressor/proline dehydrogenase/delta 1-pyrroline-5-carboxylate dehydrogenase
MVVDSSALPEQVVADAIASAFDSAGQRCSALRLLCLQEEIAERVLPMLAGAMAELAVGDPSRLATDVGPIIDEAARAGLEAHIARLGKSAKLVARAPGPRAAHGHFVAPVAFEIGSVAELGREVFGPVLHIVRFRAGELARMVEEINATGYGLTFGVHSRLDSTIDFLSGRIRAGNVYVNRNVVGAVVGVQPFGGEGLSGTGPKAGGPRYLRALARRAAPGLGDAEPLLPAGVAVAAPDCATAVAAIMKPGTDAIDRGRVLDSLAAKAGSDFALLAGDGRMALADSRERELAGPTGERNTWSAHPRGLTVALGDEGDSASAWLAQAMAAIAAGNPVLLVAAADPAVAAKVAAWVREAGWPAIAAARATSAEWSAIAPLAAVMAGSPAQAAQAVLAVAARPGARIPVVEPEGAPARYPAWRLECERTVSVNTVAAGGNASLLAQMD